MTPRDDLVCVGAIAGAFGVRGELRLKSFTDDPETLLDLGPLLDETGAPWLTITRSRVINDGFAVFAKEVATREAAEALKSKRLYVTRDMLPKTDEDEFYHADLVGLRVVSLTGEPLGEVRSVQNYGASDLLEIWKTPDVRQPWMLPFSKQAVPYVDLAKGELVADIPEGMGPLTAHDEKPDDGAGDGGSDAPSSSDGGGDSSSGGGD